MKLCRTCGAPMEDEAAFCPMCGAKNKIVNINGETTFLDNISEETTVLNSNAVSDYVHVSQQTEIIKPKKKLSKGAIISIVIGCVGIVVALLAIIIGSSSGSDYDSFNDYSVYLDDTSVNFSLDYDTGYTLSDNLFDYQIKVGNIVYQFPMTVQEFMNTGLSYSQYENPNDKISSGYSDIVTFTYADGSIVNAELVNFTKSETEYANCHVVGVSIYAANGDLKFDASNVSVSKGITLGVSTRNDVDEFLGNPNDIIESDYQTVTYRYAQDYYKCVELNFDENDTLNSIKIENVTQPENVIESGASDVAPQLVSNYKKPTSLGDDVASGNYELEGVLYKLPTPISEFIANGWKITEKDSETIAGRNYTYCVLSNGNAELSNVYVRNYEEYEIPIENGVITQITSTSFTYGKDGVLLFPKDISLSMSDDKFESEIKGADYTTERTETDVRYHFSKDNIRTQIYVENNKVSIIAMYWEEN